MEGRNFAAYRRSVGALAACLVEAAIDGLGLAEILRLAPKHTIRSLREATRVQLSSALPVIIDDGVNIIEMEMLSSRRMEAVVAAFRTVVEACLQLLMTIFGEADVGGSMGAAVFELMKSRMYSYLSTAVDKFRKEELLLDDKCAMRYNRRKRGLKS